MAVGIKTGVIVGSFAGPGGVVVGGVVGAAAGGLVGFFVSKA